MKEKVTYFIMAIIYLAILYSLVRPGSRGTAIVSSIGSALTDLVRGVTGQTFDKTTGKWSVNG